MNMYEMSTKQENTTFEILRKMRAAIMKLYDRQPPTLEDYRGIIEKAYTECYGLYRTLGQERANTVAQCVISEAGDAYRLQRLKDYIKAQINADPDAPTKEGWLIALQICRGDR